jgi:dTMP kinase
MKFVTIEGGEGCGKTTQSKLLLKAFKAANIDAVYTREPGGTENAEAIRNLLVAGTGEKWLPVTELLLHNAARYEHARKMIEPAIKEGKIVICDRFVDSTMAYQGFGLKVGKKLPAILHNILLNALAPELTIILDVDPNIGLARVQAAGKGNRYETMDDDFHARVRQGFLEILNMAPSRCVIVKTDKKIEEVHQAIIDIVNKSAGLALKAVALENCG